MRAFAFVLAFISCAFAYQVLSPNESQGWTNQGGQLLTWQRVDTDPQNFTAVLTNQQITNFDSQILAALVDGSTGSQKMNPPSGGWPVGKGFRVNLVRDAQSLNTILAQSGIFEIVNPATQTSSGVVNTNTNTLSTTPVVVAPPPTIPAATTPSATNTDPIIPPTSGASITTMNAFTVGVLSLLGVALAA